MGFSGPPGVTVPCTYSRNKSRVNHPSLRFDLADIRTQLAPNSIVYGFPEGSLPKFVCAHLPPISPLYSTITKSDTEDCDSACFTTVKKVNCMDCKRLTAAMMPAVPAPKTATFVFRQFDCEYRGDAKVIKQGENESATKICHKR